ncbi:MAG: hypothetical protein ABIK09_16805 [Pseudomonadota bacterium]
MGTRSASWLMALAFLVSCNGGTTITPGGDVPDGSDGSTDAAEVDAGPDGDAGGSGDIFDDQAAPVDMILDSEPLCAPGTGCFLDPCAENGDCLSGWCVTHLGTGVCTETCQEECPAGWTCQQVAGTDPDVIFVCISDFATLCVPCSSAADCGDVGGTQAPCVVFGESEGAFCGGSCEADGDCPGGFRCEEVPTVQGATLAQCVPEEGECACTARSIELGLGTPCAVSSEEGVCPGTRVCLEEGLTVCDAPEPVAELCNGADDDCDGQIDEETCDDDNPCTEDACLGEAGCEHVALEGGECFDGNPCTAADHCVAGVCVGDPVLCDDQNPCTDDSCTETGGCAHVPNVADCDDGDPCTVADECGAGLCAGTPVSCDCATDADCLPLEDGDLCNGTLVCDTGGLPFQCVVDPETVIGCPQAEGVDAPCLVPACDGEVGECGFAPGPDGVPCDDGDPCTIADTCAAGTCAPGAAANCNDGDPCTDDACEPGVGCTQTPNILPCEDGDVCTVGDACQGGLCVGGAGLACDDGNPCTDDSCAPQSGCVHVPNTSPCDDQNACTAGDACKSGSCTAGAAIPCSDNELCTDDSCDPDVGCVYTVNAVPCDDGDVCTMGDVCALGSCTPGGSFDCGDGNPCTDDSCDPDDGCLHVNNTAGCDDGNTCTTGDACSAGVCGFEEVVICDDGNPCTTDYCSPIAGCLTLANTLPCDDGDACTTGDVCGGGACGGAGVLTCDDGNPCTDDACDPESGCEFPNNADGCDDGNACTTVDVCGGGVCHGVVAPDCDDGDLCTTDSCDPEDGCVHVHNTAPCDDSNACTTVDLCTNGTCVGSSPMTCEDGDPCTMNSCDPDTGCVYPTIYPCCGNLVVEVPEGCDDGNQSGGDGCSASCQVEISDCNNGAAKLSTSPGGDMVICSKPSTCEQDYETLCPPGWLLCSPKQFNGRNTGWSYSVGGTMALGAIRCRSGSGAGHFTVDNSPLSNDEADNCWYGSSRPSCPSGYGCNEQGNYALCCQMNPSCGNGVVDHPEEECDDGNANDGDSCLSNCETRFGGGC